MVFLTRRERFNAAHKLWNPELSDKENDAIFGKCANPNWHGHNYQLFVTVKGMPNPNTGFVINLKALSALLKKKIVDKLDHKNLNLDVDFMKGKYSSTEVLAIEIWKQIEKPISKLGAQLHSVKIQETENNEVEYLGN